MISCVPLISARPYRDSCCCVQAGRPAGRQTTGQTDRQRTDRRTDRQMVLSATACYHLLRREHNRSESVRFKNLHPQKENQTSNQPRSNTSKLLEDYLKTISGSTVQLFLYHLTPNADKRAATLPQNTTTYLLGIFPTSFLTPHFSFSH